MISLNTETVLIHGKQRSGKTLLVCLLSYEYARRIYGNLSIYAGYKNELNKGVDICEKITKVSDFNNFFKIGEKENEIPGCCIIDEVGMNFNSKEGTTKKNMIFSKFLWLQGKYNLTGFYIAQRLNSISIDFRELASVIFEVKKVPRKGTYPIFDIIHQKFIGNEGELEILKTERVDLIGLLKEFKIGYETTETSVIYDDTSSLTKNDIKYN